MRTDGQKHRVAVPRSAQNSGFIPSSFRAISGYLRIVSSGASSVASTVRSAGASVTSSIADRVADANRDQVHWAGFDKLESDGNKSRQVLLLAYQSGFQVWDVEESDNVHELVSRSDGPVSSLQIQQKPLASVRYEDKFSEHRPLLVVAGDGSPSRSDNIQERSAASYNGSVPNRHELENDILPTVVQFYSLKSHSYVHSLKFRSAVYAVRSSPRVVAICQAAQIHCFDALTLEREYTILTSPIISGSLSLGGIGYGPLAVGSRWLAYSGSPVAVSNTDRVNGQHLAPSQSFSGSFSNGSLVANYAKESSKQIAAGIVTLGDMGYKKLSRYCSELLPDSNNSLRSGCPGSNTTGIVNGHIVDADNVGMVIVRDIVHKSVITQFRAHKSPISALCFDPSGLLLVTASNQGHNINVFRIMPLPPGNSSGSDSCSSYIHLYRLQRGFTNAVIQDISFSMDSRCIMISSSRGTSHLFEISPSGGSMDLQFSDASFDKNEGLGTRTIPVVHHPDSSGSAQLNGHNLCLSSPPVTLSVVSRIKNGNNGWRGTVTGAAAAAAGKSGFLSGAIASSFNNCKSSDVETDFSSLKKKYHLLVFSPTGCLVQYVLRLSKGSHCGTTVSGAPVHPNETDPDSGARLVVEALQKWDICQRQNRRERMDNVDIYGEHMHRDSCKIFPEEINTRRGSYRLDSNALTKAKISSQERHNFYISEAELQMHQARSPLWAKSQVYFHIMLMDEIHTENGSASGGELEIERTQTHMIEARSKDLIPVFEPIQTCQFQQSRAPSFDGNHNKQLLHQRSGVSDGKSSCR